MSVKLLNQVPPYDGCSLCTVLLCAAIRSHRQLLIRQKAVHDVSEPTLDLSLAC